MLGGRITAAIRRLAQRLALTGMLAYALVLPWHLSQMSFAVSAPASGAEASLLADLQFICHTPGVGENSSDPGAPLKGPGSPECLWHCKTITALAFAVLPADVAASVPLEISRLLGAPLADPVIDGRPAYSIRNRGPPLHA